MAISHEAAQRAFEAGKQGGDRPGGLGVRRVAGAALRAYQAHRLDVNEQRELYAAGQAVGDADIAPHEALSRYRTEKAASEAAARSRKDDRRAARGHNVKGVVLEGRGGLEKTAATLLLPFGLTAGAVGGIFKGIQWVANRVSDVTGAVGDASVGAAAANLGLYEVGDQHAQAAFSHYDDAETIRARLHAPQELQAPQHASAPHDSEQH